MDPNQADVMRAYLDTLQALAESMGQACPPVGGAYEQRVSRLRTRLAFQGQRGPVDGSTAASKQNLEQIATDVHAELREYSSQVSRYVSNHLEEMGRVVKGLEEIGQSMVQRQDYYAARMRQLALRMETTQYPENPELINDAVAIHSFELAEFAESLRAEGSSLRQKMQELRADADVRLAEDVVTDALTGLINRREMERRLAECRIKGQACSRLLFQLDGLAQARLRPGQQQEVIRQAAARLASACRPEDVVARWGEAEFLVMCRGAVGGRLDGGGAVGDGSDDSGDRRAAEMSACLRESYTLDSGERFNLQAHMQRFEPEPVLV